MGYGLWVLGVGLKRLTTQNPKPKTLNLSVKFLLTE
jgi:hypothetical protein